MKPGQMPERIGCCDGLETPRSVWWHTHREIKPCPRARAHEDATKGRLKHRGINGKVIIWKPGTSILVPEIDPL